VDGLVRHTAGHTPVSIAVELSSQDALVGDLIASGILLGGIAFTGRAMRPPFEDDPQPANWNALYAKAPNASTWVMAVP
jgi:hydroxyacylglutathione hydrolase